MPPVSQNEVIQCRRSLARSTGNYFFHQKLREPNPVARDVELQEELLAECARISGIRFRE
jgi:hypothetical protein